MNPGLLIPRHVPNAMLAPAKFSHEAGNFRHTYADGRPYRSPRSTADSPLRPFLQSRLTATLRLPPGLDWPGFWNAVQTSLRKKAFRQGTLRTYRQVLRSFRSYLAATTANRSPMTDHPSSASLSGLPPQADPPKADRSQPSSLPSSSPSGLRSHPSALPSSSPSGLRSHPSALPPSPASVTSRHVKAFIHHLVDKQVSGSWQSVCVAVLRTAFDKLAGLSVTAGLCTPKRPIRLGDLLSSGDVARMVEAAPTIRDRLILGLLYGCGLKVGELCRLRWQDVDVASRELIVRARHASGGGALARSRRLTIPEALMPVLALGVRQCPAHDAIFRGPRPDKPLSERSIERIVRRLALDAGLWKDVCCMTLRHSYAVTQLRQGANTCQVQENLGHQSIKTTLRYKRYILPPDVVSPADRLPLSPTDNSSPALQVSGLSLHPSLPPPLLAPESFHADALELPFPEIPSPAQEFYTRLKTCLKDRFLALRASAKSLLAPSLEGNEAGIRVIRSAGSSP